MLYKNKYRIESARRPNWDYSAAGFYFFTICTFERRHFFGAIDAGPPARLLPTGVGGIADASWYRIPGKYSFAELDEWIVMPNHVHGILRLTSPETTRRPVTPDEGGITGSHNHMIFRQSLATVLGWYKGRVKFEAGKTFPKASLAWQPKFHDRVIRNQRELDSIRQYIRDNPKNWLHDDLNEPPTN